MTDISTINKVRTVVYAALGLKSGLTDLTITIVPPSGTAPTATFTAVANHPGIYIATYTPTILGVYQEYIVSPSNGDNLMDAFLSMSADNTDNENAIVAAQAQITALAAQVTTLQGNVTTILNILTKQGGYIN
jgi:hypothetical protein